jgi:hypothetical protein
MIQVLDLFPDLFPTLSRRRKAHLCTGAARLYLFYFPPLLSYFCACCLNSANGEIHVPGQIVDFRSQCEAISIIGAEGVDPGSEERSRT